MRTHSKGIPVFALTLAAGVACQPDVQAPTTPPGFQDSHCHLISGGIFEMQCNLLGLNSVDAVETTLRECAEPASSGKQGCIIGGGGDNSLWPEGDPGKELLDEIFPERLVSLTSLDGHSLWVNSKALDIAGITVGSEDPPQGAIERHPDTGEPTGTLRDWAAELVEEHIPDLTLGERIAGLETGMRIAHGFGITAGIDPDLDEFLIDPVFELESCQPSESQGPGLDVPATNICRLMY